MGFGMTNNLTPRGATGNVFGQGMTGGAAREKVPRGYRVGQLQQLSPEQMQLFQQLFSQVSPESFLSRLAGGDEELFGQMEAPALRQFSGLMGNIASRFSGMGDIGGRQSSGFQNTASKAASDFAQDLQSRRLALQQQGIRDLADLSNQLLGVRPQERFLVQKQRRPSGLARLLGLGGGALAGGLVGGPAGALMGAQTGYGIGDAFSGGGGAPINITSAGLPSSWRSSGPLGRMSNLENSVLSSIYG